MNRRSFLASLVGGLAAAHELDIEKLLWVPGQKTIFVPPVEMMPPFTAQYYGYMLQGSLMPPPWWDRNYEGLAAMMQAVSDAAFATCLERAQKLYQPS